LLEGFGWDLKDRRVYALLEVIIINERWRNN